MVPMAAGKRSYGHMLAADPGSYETSKRHRRGGDAPRSSAAILQQFTPQQQQELFRILCPVKQIGNVLGKGGSIIKALRQQTGARIKIDNPISGSDEQVIVIGAYDAGDDDDYPAAAGGAATAAATLDKDDRGMDDYTEGREVVCAAQLALFKVHMRIIDDDMNESEDTDYPKVVTRMLVPENQVGCLLGKRGRIIEQMRDETGSQIRILPRDALPDCALQSDEVVQVLGDRPSVKRALNAISTRLLDNPPKDRPTSAPSNYGSGGGGGGGGGAARSSGFPNNDSYIPLQTSMLPPRIRPESRADPTDNGYVLLRPTAPGLSEFGTGRHMIPMDQELVFRILCPSGKISNIIGESESVIRLLREKTGANIIVADSVPGCEERVVIVSAHESPDEDLSPAQEAMFHIQDRLREEGGDVSERVVTRLLVPSNQVGCLLGKGGTIISEMRNSTKAIIRVLDREQLPLCALDNDEVVQILGEIRLARDALVQITSRLRANLYREKNDRSEDYGYQRGGSPMSGYGGPAAVQRSPPWLLQQTERGGYNAMGNMSRLTSYAGIDRGYALPGERAGMPSGLGNLSVVTSTKIDVLIPEVTLPAVLGQNGDNLTQISKMSGAKVVLAGTANGDRLIEISGSPDQTNIAKTLVEAFVVTGNKRN